MKWVWWMRFKPLYYKKILLLSIYILLLHKTCNLIHLIHHFRTTYQKINDLRWWMKRFFSSTFIHLIHHILIIQFS
jgi:hypothetical protein